MVSINIVELISIENVLQRFSDMKHTENVTLESDVQIPEHGNIH